MKASALLASIERKRFGALALSAAAILLGLVIPPLPLLRRQATSLAAVAAALWLLLVLIFFFVAFGPALFGHVALWLAASVAMMCPVLLQRLETKLQPLIKLPLRARISH